MVDGGHARHTDQHRHARHCVCAQQLLGFLRPAEATFRMHEIAGQYEEQRHVEGEADRHHQLRGVVRDEYVRLNGAVPQNHGKNGNAFGYVEETDSLHSVFGLLPARSTGLDSLTL